MRHSTAPPSSGIRLTRALIDRRRKTGGHRPESLLTDDLPYTAPAKNIGALVGDMPPGAKPILGQGAAGVA
jgi:hypothetical protein